MTEKSFETEIAENAKRLLFRVQEAALAANRDPTQVRLMAVTKRNNAQRVNAAIAAGITLLGENRAQELQEKYAGYHLQGCDLHFIGALQTNKVRAVLPMVSMVESLDRPALAQELQRRAAATGRVLPVLVQVNIGQEATKSGVAPAQLEEFLAQVAEFSHLSVRGLMAIPPNVENPQEKEAFFEQMYRHFIDMKAKKMDNISMEILSMGMSYDFVPAIRHGSNIVRIGRALFGERL